MNRMNLKPQIESVMLDITVKYDGRCRDFFILEIVMIIDI